MKMRRILVCSLLLSCAPSDRGGFPPNQDVDAVAQPLPIEGQCNPLCGPCPPSPIVIDVAGNGFDLTDVRGGVSFDLEPGGASENLAWTAAGSDDSWLVLDRNANGAIDDGSELFGNLTEQPEPTAGRARNGYAALAVFDENGDGVLSAADSVFASLRLWQDRDHDGLSRPEELSSLSSHGIRGLGTDYRVHRRTDENGNLFRYSAMVYRDAGSTVGPRSFDVFLVTEAALLKAEQQGLVSKTGTSMAALVAPQEECGVIPGPCTLGYKKCFDVNVVNGNMLCDENTRKFVSVPPGTPGAGNLGVVNVVDYCVYQVGGVYLDVDCANGSTICCPRDGCSVY